MSNADTHARRGQYLNLPDQGTAAPELQEVLSLPLPFCRCAFRLVGNAADAEDVVQEALLASYKHIDEFRGQSQMSTWLTTIVCNCARMQLRKRPRQIHTSLDEQIGEKQRATRYGLYAREALLCSISEETLRCRQSSSAKWTSATVP